MTTENNIRMPLLGDQFPEMTVQTTHGPRSLPQDMKGKRFVLFSHPADFTPVCTTEFIAFQDRYDKFKALNCELVGMSVDQVFSHIKREERIKDNMNVEIQFPIIADTWAVAAKLWLIHPGKGTNTVRAVFVVDDKWTIRTILYYPQELGRNMDEILRIVEAMQLADKNKVAMPADRPNNAIIKDHVIIPPANNTTLAQERKEQAKKWELECFDRRFCHKAL